MLSDRRLVWPGSSFYHSSCSYERERIDPNILLDFSNLSTEQLILHVDMYIVHWTRYHVPCTLYIVHCTWDMVQCTWDMVQCTWDMVHRTLYNFNILILLMLPINIWNVCLPTLDTLLIKYLKLICHNYHDIVWKKKFELPIKLYFIIAENLFLLNFCSKLRFVSLVTIFYCTGRVHPGSLRIYLSLANLLSSLCLENNT